MTLEVPGNSSSVWLLPLIVAAIPLFWLAIMFLIARLGGWAALAKACPAPGRPPGTGFCGLSLHIAPATSYGGCISAVFSPDGLYLIPLVIFRFGHRPVLIPWEHVGAPVEQRCLGFRRVHLPVGVRGRTARLRLSRKAQRWLQGGDPAGSWRPVLAPAPDPSPSSSPFRHPSSWRGH
jgi:hypothetical protein